MKLSKTNLNLIARAVQKVIKYEVEEYNNNLINNTNISDYPDIIRSYDETVNDIIKYFDSKKKIEILSEKLEKNGVYVRYTDKAEQTINSYTEEVKENLIKDSLKKVPSIEDIIISLISIDDNDISKIIEEITNKYTQ